MLLLLLEAIKTSSCPTLNATVLVTTEAPSTIIVAATAGAGFFLTIRLKALTVVFPDLLRVAVNVTDLSSEASLVTVPLVPIIEVFEEVQLTLTPECPVKLVGNFTLFKTLSCPGFPFNTKLSVKENLAWLTANSSKSVVPRTVTAKVEVVEALPLEA